MIVMQSTVNKVYFTDNELLYHNVYIIRIHYIYFVIIYYIDSHVTLKTYFNGELFLK